MADLVKDKWMKVMTVTITVLGVVASIAASRASFYVAKTQLLTAQEADQWAYYEAKSIKEDLYKAKIKAMEYKKIGPLTPEEENLFNRFMLVYSKEIYHYENDKQDIKHKAQGIDQKNKDYSQRGSQFSLSIVFAQIALMLAGVAMLLKLRRLWFIGVSFGLVSIVFIANGFLLFLKI